ncbi:MAG: AAA family ATPase [Alphaproteobacteria bacterium]|nr:AAA family ATPase [Alphaproteobacteria bacterium]MBU1560711.1 AAA family ATPase [Alphaproteobacteria bacterium]MBU2302920.1 AAA family ATPase [Alphaproteobacteria bacterium]MBU2367647.1 AAA family ATPase [Alphaproteobacteria bacterium]
MSEFEDFLFHEEPCEMKTTRKNTKDARTVQERLADLMVERAFPKPVRNAMSKGTSGHLVVVVPSTEWQEPIGEALGEMADGVHPVYPGTPKTIKDDRRAVKYHIEANHLVVGVAVTPGSLPALLRTVASMTVSVPSPDAALIRALIRGVCTGPIPRVLGTLNFAVLDFDEICSTVTAGANAGVVVANLARAISNKTGMARAGEVLPDMDQAVEFGAARLWAQDLKIDLADVAAQKISWADVDRGIILHGPPGTGKTTYARSLGEYLGIPVVIGSIAELFAGTTGYLDTVIRAQRELFERARSAAPCLLFLDELDQVPSLDATESKNRDYWAPVVADFLVALDGAVAERHGVIVVGATNRLHAISPAIRRNGRLERSVFLGPPGPDGALRILRHHLGAALHDVDLGEIAAICASRSMTGADIMDVARSARRRARRADRDLTPGDLKAVLVPELDLPPEVVRRIAVHESGHAILAALYMPENLVKVTIEPGGTKNSSGGHTQLFMPDSPLETAVELEHRVEMLLGGRAAEILTFDAPSSGAGGSASSDLALAVQTLATSYLTLGLSDDAPRWRCPPDEAMTYMLRDPVACRAVESRLAILAEKSLQTLAANRDALRRISESLIERRTMYRDEILSILDAKGTLPSKESRLRPQADHRNRVS